MRMLLSSLVLGALVCGPALPARVAACPPARIKVRAVKSGGIAGLRFETNTDSADLAAEQARKLRRLIDAARFFELPATFPDSGVRDDFDYTITVEIGGREHTVSADE